MDITVNGTTRSVPDPSTVASVVTAVLGPGRGGIALALNGTVLPQAFWAEQAVQAGDRLEIIMARQGG